MKKEIKNEINNDIIKFKEYLYDILNKTQLRSTTINRLIYLKLIEFNDNVKSYQLSNKAQQKIKTKFLDMVSAIVLEQYSFQISSDYWDQYLFATDPMTVDIIRKLLIGYLPKETYIDMAEYGMPIKWIPFVLSDTEIREIIQTYPTQIYDLPVEYLSSELIDLAIANSKIDPDDAQIRALYELAKNNKA